MASWSAIVVSHKEQSDLLKPNTSFWLRCVKTRESMTLIFRTTEMMERDAPFTATSPLSSHSSLVDERHFHPSSTISTSTHQREREREKLRFENRRLSLSCNASATPGSARCSRRCGRWCRAPTGTPMLKERRRSGSIRGEPVPRHLVPATPTDPTTQRC